MPVINQVAFNYVKIKTAAPKYGETQGCSIDKCEYTVQVCIPAATAKALKKHPKYKKIAAIKDMDEVDAAAYEKTFKVKPPEGDIYPNEDGDFFMLRLSNFAGYKDGTPVPEELIPRVLGSVKKDGQTYDVTGKMVNRQVEIGNGSLGKVSFKERDWEYNGKKGISLDLTGVQVTNLVEYVSKTANVNEFDFDEAGDDFAVDEDAVPGMEADEGEAQAPVDSGTPVDKDEW